MYILLAKPHELIRAMPIRMTWFFIGKWYCNKTLFSSQNPTLGLIWGQGVTFDVFEVAGLIFTHKLPWLECYIALCKTTLFYLPLPCHPLSLARPPPHHFLWTFALLPHNQILMKQFMNSLLYWRGYPPISVNIRWPLRDKWLSWL